MRNRHNESGQVLVLTALSLTAMLGFVALAVDVGSLFRARRNLQIAADAAATAGALDYLYNQSNSSAQTVATAAATQNGVTAGGGTVVTVNAPPVYGYHTGAGYVEVILQQPNPTFFMKVFGFNSMTVAARAVAGTPGGGNDCVYVLDPTASGAMTLQGSFDVSTPDCGVVVDSNSSDALQFTGGGGTLTAGSVSVTGGDGGQTGDSTPTPVTHAAPISDPFKGVYTTNPTCTLTTSVTSVAAGSAAATSGGVVCFTNAVTFAGPLTLASGVYVLDAGGTFTGAVTSGAGGTTFDVAGGGFNVGTGSTLDLVAPTSGTYNGILIMDLQPSGSTLQLQFGSSSGTMTGIIYAPNSYFTLHDSGGDHKGGVVLNADLIVGTFYDQTATLTINSYSAATPTSPLKKVSLVE